MGSAAYRVVTNDGTVYFLKLRKGFNEIVVTVSQDGTSVLALADVYSSFPAAMLEQME